MRYGGNGQEISYYNNVPSSRKNGLGTISRPYVDNKRNYFLSSEGDSLYTGTIVKTFGKLFFFFCQILDLMSDIKTILFRMS